MSLDKFIERAEKLSPQDLTDEYCVCDFCRVSGNWHKVITALKEAKRVIRFSKDGLFCKTASEIWLEKWDKEFTQ